MKFRILTLALLLSLSGLFYSCAEGSDADRAADEIEMETENALSDLGAEVREESNEMERNFRDTRRNIDARLEEMERDMEGASAEARAEMQEEYDELEAYGREVDGYMDRVGNNFEAGWKDFKGDAKSGWADFKRDADRTMKNIERSLDPEGDLE